MQQQANLINIFVTLYYMQQHHFQLQPGLGKRLFTDRSQKGFKQGDIAEIGQIARQTQKAYEEDLTSPTAAYLSRVQKAGIDIPYVLFGLEGAQVKASVSWDLLIKIYQEVDEFIFKNAPQCPETLRWKLVRDVYETIGTAQATCSDSGELTARVETTAAIKDSWSRLIA
jgi:transcriptional regulator with XRE-family HTH domain